MRKYHTELVPIDRSGQPLKPMDLVIIEEIPDYYWAESDCADPGLYSLKLYAGCYGLVNYAEQDGVEYLPFFLGNKKHPGWVNGEGNVVHVHSRRSNGEEILSWDFWLPSGLVRKIPYNSIVMNIFVEYPWQMRDDDGPSCSLFIRKGMREFEYISKILQTPYDVLVHAHEAAMEIISQGQR